MKNRFHSFKSCLKFVAITFCVQQLTAQVAPIAPVFLDYQNKLSNGTLVKTTSDGHYLGYAPSPVKPTFNAVHTISTAKKMNLPAVYDMRTNNTITTVKDQGQCGSCWLFPSMGTVESRWKILGFGDLNLAENGLKHCHGFDYGPCDGGDEKMAAAYLLRGSGPLNEVDDPYTALSSANCGTTAKPLGYVTGAIFLPSDIDAIKQAVLDYGAATVSFRWDSPAFDKINRTHYYKGSESLNHMVLIVGWDDTKVTQAPNPGAWIIKNSWGALWGENGFFYLSYEDKFALNDVTIFHDRIAYDADLKINGYDELGWNSSIGFGKNQYALVKFDAAAAQTIKRVGTYATADNMVITFDIYDNFNGTTLSGLLGSKTVTAEYPGFYSADLNTPININTGNDYYVRINYARSVNAFLIPVEAKQLGYTSKAVIETGKCWTSSTGTSWNQIGEKRPQRNDVCLKVYTTGSSCPTPQPTFTLNSTAISICANTNSSLSVSPTNASYTYQWQQSIDQGTTWTNILNNANFSGATTASIQILNTPSTFNGRRFRCVVSNGTCFALNSNVATFTVGASSSITKQPINRSVKKGAQTTFAITLSTISGATMQWQLSTNNGSSWTNISATTQYTSVTKTTLTVRSITTAMNGYRYRCLVNLKCGNQLISNAGLLNVVGAKLTEEAELANINSSDDSQVAVLYQNRPNPLTGESVIVFSLPTAADVAIELSNSNGLKVMDVLAPQLKDAGDHEVTIFKNELNTGTYIYTLLYRLNGSAEWKRISKTLIIQ